MRAYLGFLKLFNNVWPSEVHKQSLQLEDGGVGIGGF